MQRTLLILGLILLALGVFVAMDGAVGLGSSAGWSVLAQWPIYRLCAFGELHGVEPVVQRAVVVVVPV